MENFEREVIAKKTMFIYGASALAEPPLGTVLGNLGVNTVKFCKEFNKFTENLPKFYRVRVIIWIFDNYSFQFKVKLPTTGLMLEMLKFDKAFDVWEKDRYNEVNYKCIMLMDLVKLAKFKFPYLELKKSIPIIMGSVKAKRLKIIY